VTTLLRRTPRQRRSRAHEKYLDAVEDHRDHVFHVSAQAAFHALDHAGLSNTDLVDAAERISDTRALDEGYAPPIMFHFPEQRSEADERRQAALEQKFGIVS
jgi:hypothetical protein